MNGNTSFLSIVENVFERFKIQKFFSFDSESVAPGYPVHDEGLRNTAYLALHASRRTVSTDMLCQQRNDFVYSPVDQCTMLKRNLLPSSHLFKIVILRFGFNNKSQTKFKKSTKCSTKSPKIPISD